MNAPYKYDVIVVDDNSDANCDLIVMNANFYKERIRILDMKAHIQMNEKR